MSYEFYKVLHFLGIFSLFFSYGGLILFYNQGGQRGVKAQKAVSMLHGIALFIILVGGFGLVARLGISFPFPLWIWIKLTVWVALGGLIVLARRRAHLLWPLYGIVILCGFIAAVAAVYKPGG